jgi:hypothetical protein
LGTSENKILFFKQHERKMAQPYPVNTPPAYTEAPQPYYPPQQTNAPIYVATTNAPPQPVMQTIIVEQHRVDHHHLHWGETYHRSEKKY